MKTLKNYMPVQLCNEKNLITIQKIFNKMQNLEGNLTIDTTKQNTILFLQKKNISLFVEVLENNEIVYICKNKSFDNLDEAIKEFLL